MRHALLQVLVRVTMPVLRLTARLARLVERVRAEAVDEPLTLLLVPVLLLAWAPCRLASLALFAACSAVAPVP